jgi:hypothetical protein
LVVGDLLELRLTDLRRAEAVVGALDGVLEVQTYGDLLHVFVEDASVQVASMPAALAAAGLNPVALRQIRPRMEDAFVSIVRKQRGQGSASKA